MLTADLPITDKHLRIQGPGGHLLTVSSSTHQIDVRRGTSISISGLSFKGSKFNATSILSNEGTLSLTNSTISGNTVAGPYSPDGGGIYNKGTLTLSNSTVSGNTSPGNGGGIANEGTLTLSNSTISGNMATGLNSQGGGIFNSNDGRLTLSNSTISGNTTTGDGGGIFNYGGTLTLSNSTVSDNTASSGGGIFIKSFISVAQADLTFSTIYANKASVGGDIAVEDVVSSSTGQAELTNRLSRVKITNTIVAGDPAHPGPDISATLISSGYNLFQDNSGATFDPATSKQHGTDKTVSVNDLTKLFAAPLVLQRDFTSAVPATGQAVACDGSDRRRSCGAADTRSKPRPQADPARVGARRPARASAPERHSAAGRSASPGQAPHPVWARDRSSWVSRPPSLWFRRCCFVE